MELTEDRSDLAYTSNLTSGIRIRVLRCIPDSAPMATRVSGGKNLIRRQAYAIILRSIRSLALSPGSLTSLLPAIQRGFVTQPVTSVAVQGLAKSISSVVFMHLLLLSFCLQFCKLLKFGNSLA